MKRDREGNLECNLLYMLLYTPTRIWIVDCDNQVLHIHVPSLYIGDALLPIPKDWLRSSPDKWG